MEKSRHEQTAEIYEPAVESGFHPSGLLLVIVAIAAFVLAIIGAVIDYRQAVQAGVLIFQIVLVILIALVGVGIPGAIGYYLWHRRRLDQITRQHAEEDLKAKQDARRRANETHEVHLYLAQSRLLPDAQGNRPFVYNPRTNDVLEVKSGNFVQNVPTHYSPHFDYKDTSTKVTEEQQGGQAAQNLLASGIKQPTQRSLLEQLEENALQVAPGIRTTDGQPVILSIPDAVHFKLIGSSGFGKSCLAAAILDQAVRLNSPDRLQIALLDLEHKTSRLFEHAPNVAILQIGRRSVPMVATSADEVALHLGYLKKELDRRALLSEYDLQSEPLMLIYVEEMLSLQFEVDEELIEQMLKDLSVLAVRARKYNMFLLACAQTDYSTPELKIAQKQFRSRIAFAIDTTAARAAGFMSTELIKYNFSNSQRGDGMYVLETPGVASLMLAPVYDVKAKVLAMDRRAAGVQQVFQPQPLRVVQSDSTPDAQPSHTSRTTDAQASEAKLEQVRQLRALGWGKVATIEKVWAIKRGGNDRWKQAEAEYNIIIAEIEQQKDEA